MQRENRTVTVDFGVSLVQYSRRHGEVGWFMRKVATVMCVVMLAAHKLGCPLNHRYTRHGNRVRQLLRANEKPAAVKISQIRCLDCGAVFTILPSFVLRYQRFHVDLAQMLLEYNLIMLSSEWLCGAPHSHSYVADRDMWRAAPGSRYKANDCWPRAKLSDT